MAKYFRIITISPDELSFALDYINEDYRCPPDFLAPHLEWMRKAFKEAPSNLIEGRDYQLITDEKATSAWKDESRYTVKFNGPSLVVRAMYTIPEGMVWGAFGLDWNQTRQSFARKLTDKTCLVYDQQFVEQAFNEEYKKIKNDINKAHQFDREVKQTSVMLQLNADLLLVDQMQVSVFKTPKPHLAIVCVANAYFEEEKQCTLPESTSLLGGLIRKKSLLSPKYDALIEKYHTGCTSSKKDLEEKIRPLLEEYKTCVAEKRKESPLISSDKETKSEKNVNVPIATPKVA